MVRPSVQRMACRGKIAEVNRRRTKSENVSAEFMSAEEGETRGMFIADAETYGADRLWAERS